MQLDGNIVVVPLWMINMVEQKGLSQSCLTDMSVLEEHVSFDDLVSYYSVNEMFKEFDLRGTFYDVRDKIECYQNLLTPLNLNKVNSKKNTAFANDSLYTHIQNESLVFLKEMDDMKDLFELMVTPSHLPTPEVPNNYVINLFHITDYTFGLTIKPNADITLNNELTSLDNNMKTLLTHYSYEQVYQTEIFHRWCFTMYNNQQLLTR